MIDKNIKIGSILIENGTSHIWFLVSKQFWVTPRGEKMCELKIICLNRKLSFRIPTFREKEQKNDFYSLLK